MFDLVIEKNIVSRGKSVGKDSRVTGKGGGGLIMKNKRVYEIGKGFLSIWSLKFLSCLPSR